MQIIIRTKNYVVKEAVKDTENDGYKFAVYTKEEAALHKLGYPEWQVDQVEEALQFIEDCEARALHAVAVEKYKSTVDEWLKSLSFRKQSLVQLKKERMH